MNRREFGQALCSAAVGAAFARLAVAQQQAHDTSGAQKAPPAKPGGIAMLIYPDMTALDLIGPQQVFGYLSPHVHLVAKTRNLVVTGIAIQPSMVLDRKSTRLNSSHQIISYAVFCLKKKIY